MNLFLSLSWGLVAFFITFIALLISNNQSSTRSENELTDEYKKYTMIFIIIFSAIVFGFLLVVPIGFHSSTFFALLILFSFSLAINARLSVPVVFMGSFIFIFTSTPLTQAIRFAERLDVTEINEPLFMNVKEANQRVLPKIVAIDRAKKALNGRNEKGEQYSSMYRIDEQSMIVQEINGELFYAAPLTWHRIDTWLLNSYDIIGYVKIKATDINAEAELITKNSDGSDISIKMTVGGYFQDNLKRFFSDAHLTVNISSYTFMVDETGYPYFVAYKTIPSIGLSGYVPDGIFLIDPQEKTSTYYKTKDIPAFIDMDADEDTLLKMVSSWGTYREGIFESFSSKITLKPTTYNNKEELFFVDATEMTNGKAFFTGLSSKKGNGGLAGMLFIDPKTLKAKISFSNKEAQDEDSIIQSVNSALGNLSDKWNPTQPIPYRLFDEIDVWLTPIVSTNSDSPKIEAYAYTRVWGTQKSQWDNKLSNALTKVLTVSSGDNLVSNLNNLKDITGMIRSVHFVNNNVFITIYQSPIIFECNHEQIVECRGLKLNSSIDFSTMVKNKKESLITSFNENPVLAK